MITYLLVAIPALLSIFVIKFWSDEKAFRNVYLPVLFFLPQNYTVAIPGFPNANFAAMALAPIVIYFFGKQFFNFLIPTKNSAAKKQYRWQFSFMDFLVVGFVLTCVTAQFIATSESDIAPMIEGWLTYHLFGSLSMGIIAPYMLAKAYIEHKQLHVVYAKRIIIMLVILIFLSLYEMRFTLNPFIAIVRPFFPGQGEDWPTLYRAGLVRIGGPFVQTIFFGLVISVGFLFNYWLGRSKLWKSYKTWYWPFDFKIPIYWLFGAVLIFGLAMTMSRGPMVGMLVGWLFASVGFSRRRVFALTWRLTLLAVLSVVAIQMYYMYQEMSTVLSGDLGGTAAYRAKLWDYYKEIIYDRPVWGWGYTTWPKSMGPKSIDNEYLFLTIKHGIVGLVAFILVIMWISVRLFIKGLYIKVDAPLCYTLLGIILGIATAIITVYLGLQTQPLYFLIMGWAEGFLLRRPISGHAKG